MPVMRILLHPVQYQYSLFFYTNHKTITMKTSIASLFSFGKKKISITLLLFICCYLIQPVQSRAQQDSLHLFSVTYIKLKDPGYAKQYENLLGYYGKKAAEYSVKSGKITGYYPLKVLMPTGSASDY